VKLYKEIIKIIIVLLVVHSCLFADNVYELKFARESAIIIPVFTLGAYSLIRSSNQTGLSEYELDNLSIYKINRFERFATQNYCERSMLQSDFLLYACLIAPFLLNINNNVSGEFLEVNTVIVQSLLTSIAFTQLTKTTFLRNRPLAYNDSVPINIRRDKDARYSFISGHTALAFTGAMLTAKIYNDFHPYTNNTLVYATAITTASTVGYLRMRAGKHFPSDVLAGAIVGTASAFLITEMHRNVKCKMKNDNSSRNAIPLHFQINF